MIFETIEKLMIGDDNITSDYQKGIEFWKQLLTNVSPNNVDQLAKELTDRQPLFEQELDFRRRLAQEIMVVVGFSQFYDFQKGFQQNIHTVEKIYEAFMNSGCSSEVKTCAEKLAKIYGIID